MRICFVLPGLSNRPTGGCKIVFEYANRLVARGHEISIAFWSDISNTRLMKVPGPMWSKRLINRARNLYEPRWFTLDPRVHKVCVFAIDDANIPDGDWVFATAVTTARGVAKLSESKGRKGYLIQDYETWDTPEDEVCATYCLGMQNIVISEWLRGIVEHEAPGTATLISNPVDTSVFFDDGLGRNPLQISALYHEGPHKGFPDAFKTLCMVRDCIPDVRVEVFGVWRRPEYFPAWINYTQKATSDQLRRIYSGSAVYICASVNEGFGLTGLEALACGCALASTDYQGVHDYAVNGGNCLLSPVHDPETLARNVVRLLSDAKLRGKLGKKGIETASVRSWDTSVDRFEHILVSTSG